MNKVLRPRVLILVRHYEPAFRFGGPIRSISNLVSALHDEFDFRIICLNRDFRETVTLSGIEEGIWLQRNTALVRYLHASLTHPLPLIRAIRSADFDLIYLNSFFDPLFSTLPALLRKVGGIDQKPLIMAPRGEFSPSALELRSFKKRIFLRVQKRVGLYKEAFWHATSFEEASQINSKLGPNANVCIAPNLASSAYALVTSRPPKQIGRLHIIFVSRIAPMKNLRMLIFCVSRLRGNIRLDVWGPMYDPSYWKDCELQLMNLPSNISATYNGELAHDKVAEVLSSAEVFALPTLGENFGHVIQEALAAGCPVVISDRTPWRNLPDQGVGFDVPLENAADFSRALQTFVDMPPDEYATYAERCRTYARNRRSDDDVHASRQMFRRALGLP